MSNHRGCDRSSWVGLAAVVCIGAAAPVGCAPPAPAAHTPPAVVLRLTTGTPGAGFHPLGQAFDRSFGAANGPMTLSIQESAGSIANVEAIQRGNADIGFSYADVAYVGFVGQLEGQRRGFDRLRGVAVLQLTPVHLIVGAGSGLRDVSQLKGRHIAVGLPGSGSALTAEIVLQALGIPRTSVRLEPLRYSEAGARLAVGSIDALFVTGSDPVESVRTAARAGARLLPLEGQPIERLRHDYPFLRPMSIPAGTYPGQPSAVRTIGVDNLLVCRRDLDEAVVHDFTRQFFAALPSLPLLRLMDAEQAPATPVPLHEGAARFYRERELRR